jgi:hypothetical protein
VVDELRRLEVLPAVCHRDLLSTGFAGLPHSLVAAPRGARRGRILA